MRLRSDKGRLRRKERKKLECHVAQSRNLEVHYLQSMYEGRCNGVVGVFSFLSRSIGL